MASEARTAGTGEAPGTGRVLAFDIARGVAVFGMIVIHVQKHWGQQEPWFGLPNLFLSVIGGPLAAPEFMLVMGASVAWSHRTDARSLAKRGVLMLAAGLALNLARGTLPLYLGQAAGVIPADGIGGFTAWGLTVTVDVFQLAGTAFLAIAALRPLLRHDLAWIGAAIAVTLVAPVLRPIATGFLPIDGALGVLWATGRSVYYPFFPWAVFPLVGMAVGRSVHRSATPERTLLRWGAVGVAAMLAGGLVMGEQLVTLDTWGYWRLDPPLALTLTGVALAWTGACVLIARVAAQTRLVRLLVTWGRGVTRLYVAHWIIVAWGLGYVGYLALPLPATIAAMAVVLVTSDLLAIRLPAWWAAGAARARASAGDRDRDPEDDRPMTPGIDAEPA